MTTRSCHVLRSTGHTLLEMMLSIVILSAVMASVTSAVIFASSANPDADSETATLTQDSRVLGQIAEDLSMARYILETSANSVTVVVSDRNGDDNPDRIRYAWSGVSGDPLTFQLNDETAYTLLDSVAVFSLTYQNETDSNQLPVASYVGEERVLDSYTTIKGPSDVEVKSDKWLGQMMTMGLAAGATSFVPTRVELYCSGKPPLSGQTTLQVLNRSSSKPGSTVYGDVVIDESKLSTVNRWQTFTLTNTVTVPADQALALTFDHLSGQNEVLKLPSEGNDGRPGSGGGYGGYLESGDGSNWSLDNGKTLFYQFYGKEYLTDTDQYTSVAQRLKQVTVSLQSVSDDRSPLTRNVGMMLAPVKVDAFTETGFDADPTPMDLDGDGSPEWTHSSGTFPGSSIADGIWTANGQLIFQPSGLSTLSVISITARMRSNDTLGPTIYGPFTIDSSNEMLPIITQLRDDGGGGQELVIYNDTTMTTEAYKLTGLPSGLIDISLTVVPDEDYLYIEVNHEPALSVLLSRITNPGTVSEAVWFGSSGGVAEFGSVYIKAGASYTTAATSDSAEGGLLSKTLELVTSR